VRRRRWDLVGLMEIAMRAGVQRPVVLAWRTRYADCPTPVAELAVGPIRGRHIPSW
jgi:hypothetical protein